MLRDRLHRTSVTTLESDEHPVGGAVHPSQHGQPVALGVDARIDGVCVLVVDDDDDSRELSALVLRGVGASVTVAASVEEALRAFVVKRPDILVSDIGMPLQDGYSLIRRVRMLSVEAGGNIPALALTAFTGDVHRARALEAGFTRHETKPIDPDRLIEVVCELAAPLRTP